MAFMNTPQPKTSSLGKLQRGHPNDLSRHFPKRYKTAGVSPRQISSAQLSSRERISRSMLLLGFFLSVFGLVQLKRASDIAKQHPAPFAPLRPKVTEKRAVEMTKYNRQMMYLHKSDILLVTLAKAGSSTLMNFLYRGVTGRQKWNSKDCGTHIHNKSSICWKGEASYMFDLPPKEQVRILTNPSTFRVALQRDPYERLISAFKSKFTCEHKQYRTDVHEREVYTKLLQKAARLPHTTPCMNISEFATALDICRRNLGKEGHLKTLRALDDHIRPQVLWLKEIDYSMILDVRHLSDAKALEPMLQRLRFPELAEEGIKHKHSSGHAQLAIPEDAAAKLYLFSLESELSEVKLSPHSVHSHSRKA